MYKKILVPVDGSDTSRVGLDEALKLAKGLQAGVRLLHGVNEMFMPAVTFSGVYVDDFIKSMRDSGNAVLEDAKAYARKQGIEAETVLVEALGNRASDLIIQHSKQWNADLIVMGTHGRRGWRRMALGSDAEHVLRESSVPVLLVRAGEASD